MNDLTKRAMLFAMDVHKDQRRKYTGNHYFDHLAEVAAITSCFIPRDDMFDHVIAAAFLHDSIEDQGQTVDIIRENFGDVVAGLVDSLSEKRPECFNRRMRKAAYREQLMIADKNAQTIKAADIFSNTKSIVENDPKFASTYIRECQETLAVLKHADVSLVQMVNKQLEWSIDHLMNNMLQSALSRNT
jgi:GTP diphosphokinase / guanosine-3',5'-bis(diphosphate) 3'-diphosphatase